MRFLVIGGLIALAAFIGGGEILGRKLPGPFQLLSRTGMGFLLLGMLMGPLGFNWFDEVRPGEPSLRQALEPITALALAWIGMLYGSHLEWARLRRFRRAMHTISLLEGSCAAAVVTAAVWAVLATWPPAGAGRGDILAAAVFCGAAAAGTAPAGLFLLRQEVRMSGPIYERLLFFCTLDDAPGLLVLLGLFAFARVPGAPDALTPAGWFVLSIGVALALSLILRLALRPGLDDERLFLVLLGALGLAAGVCGLWHLSPLPVGVLAGAITINYSRQKERVYQVLQNREHTIYILFLVLAGSLVRVDAAVAGLGAALIGLLVVARMAGKLAGTSGPRLVGSATAVPVRAGLALMPQGGMALAMSASFAHAYARPGAGEALAQLAASAVVIAVVANDLLGAWIAPAAIRGVRD